jgi:parallel beta-helix repeat protein
MSIRKKKWNWCPKPQKPITTKKLTKPVFLVFLSLLSLCVVSVQPVKSNVLENVVIKADGSVVGTDKIQRNGNLYTLTGLISGGIRVERSYIVIDGAGHTIRGNGTGIGINISYYFSYGYESPIYGSTAFVNNVTVVNLRIFSFNTGIFAQSTSNNTFIGNYIEGCETGVSIMSSRNNILTHNTVRDCVTGISINYSGAGDFITENNIINNNVLVWLSSVPVVDSNYWEGGSYQYIDEDNVRHVDNHPLGSPVNISDFEFPPIPKAPLDAKPPTVSVFSPKNITYAVNNVYITLNVTEPPSWIGYSLDGQANVTIAEPTTLTELSDGKHSLTVYANDTAGNTGVSDTVYFIVKTQQSAAFPTTLIVAAIAIIVVAISIATVYLIRKRKK